MRAPGLVPRLQGLTTCAARPDGTINPGCLLIDPLPVTASDQRDWSATDNARVAVSDQPIRVIFLDGDEKPTGRELCLEPGESHKPGQLFIDPEGEVWLIATVEGGETPTMTCIYVGRGWREKLGFWRLHAFYQRLRRSLVRDSF